MRNLFIINQKDMIHLCIFKKNVFFIQNRHF